MLDNCPHQAFCAGSISGRCWQASARYPTSMKCLVNADVWVKSIAHSVPSDSIWKTPNHQRPETRERDYFDNGKNEYLDELCRVFFRNGIHVLNYTISSKCSFRTERSRRCHGYNIAIISSLVSIWRSVRGAYGCCFSSPHLPIPPSRR